MILETPPYYRLFELPVRLELDGDDLRKRFLSLNRRFHPDFFTLESEDKQAEALAKSTEINRAYQVLASENDRMAYVLRWYGLLADEGQEKMDAAFLMEMMDANEALAELAFQPDTQMAERLFRSLSEKEESLKSAAFPALRAFDGSPETMGELKNIKEYYLKMRYLLRIREKLHNFAAAK